MALDDVLEFMKSAAFRTGANAAYLYGLSELSERMPEIGSVTEAVSTGIAALSLIPLNRYIVGPLARRIAEHESEGFFAKSLTVLGLFSLNILPGYGLKDEVQDVFGDVLPFVRVIVPEEEDLEEIIGRNKKIGFNEKFQLPDFSKVQLAPRESTIGRIQRAYRWKPVADAVERKYGIPSGTLLAMAMHESYGDPLQPNASNDGGIGLLHMQGTTAKSLGLRIYGSSRRDSDKKHGKSLKAMIEECNYRLHCVAKEDDRGHPLKNLDAAARYMIQGVRVHGSWDSGIKWYRGPGHVHSGTGRRYLKVVKKNRTALNENGLEEAEADFSRRNHGRGITFDDYMKGFHDYSRNFGLEKYR
ncbi:hypothetical protein HYT52_01780 [Candidatus Woesearchaeota archaeon]|nr:hypothetical protein [Candidatus Woesearchaeota archaeon]